MEKKTFSVLSSDGIHCLSGVVYLPEGEIKGLFHVAHGMREHIGRYDRFLTAMAQQGYLSFGYDHLGHGHTAKDDSELGYIAKEKGWEHLAKDIQVFSDAVRQEFGTETMPYYLMGHSMGSFVVRLAAERFVKPQKLIVMGTAGANPAAAPGLALIAVIKAIKGEKHISDLMENIAFGGYNARFGGDDENDMAKWLSNDEAVRASYYQDKFCMFRFTTSAMGDLVRSIKYSNDPSWFVNIPADMPILLVSGADDPVGNYGKGVLEVEKKLKQQGKSVTCKLYSGARHEILNDFTYDAVLSDILAFLQSGK